jgi:hypothetical protein
MCYYLGNKTELNMATKPLTKFLTVRIKPADHKKFHSKAERYGGVSEVLREMIEAFIDDRLTVKPNPRKESLYVQQ